MTRSRRPLGGRRGRPAGRRAAGLLGKAVVRQPATRLPGAAPDRCRGATRPPPHEALVAAVADRLRGPRPGGPWRVAWCAGAGVTGTSQDALDRRGARPSRVPGRAGGGDAPPAGSALFLASSAGALYAGSHAGASRSPRRTRPGRSRPTATPSSPPNGRPREFADRTGVSVLVGRISNLYGPGQNLAKPQGLVSHICRAQLSGQPISVYVSLDTVRDYLFVDDAAGLICDALDRLAVAPAGTVGDQDPGQPARGDHRRAARASAGGWSSGRPGWCSARRRSPSCRSRDLRMRSVVWPELDRRTLTTLPAGINATNADLLRGLQLGERRAG